MRAEARRPYSALSAKPANQLGGPRGDFRRKEGGGVGGPRPRPTQESPENRPGRRLPRRARDRAPFHASPPSHRPTVRHAVRNPDVKKAAPPFAPPRYAPWRIARSEARLPDGVPRAGPGGRPSSCPRRRTPTARRGRRRDGESSARARPSSASAALSASTGSSRPRRWRIDVSARGTAPARHRCPRREEVAEQDISARSMRRSRRAFESAQARGAPPSGVVARGNPTPDGAPRHPPGPPSVSRPCVPAGSAPTVPRSSPCGASISPSIGASSVRPADAAAARKLGRERGDAPDAVPSRITSVFAEGP